MKSRVSKCVLSMVAAAVVLVYSNTHAGMVVLTKQGEQAVLYGASYALLIGVSDYTAGWRDLPGVTNDLVRLKDTMRKHSFQVVEVKDPTGESLRRSIDDFIVTCCQNESDRILIWFGGHGYTLPMSYGEEVGFLVPADAPLPDADRKGFVAKALDMAQMEVYAKRIQSKHALFVFDSCFSGSIFSLSRGTPASITHKTGSPVRFFITAGTRSEQVPDSSIFCSQFLEGLGGAGDLNRDGYITGVELSEYLTTTVINYSRNTQHPTWGLLRNAYLDKGDIVFVADGTNLTTTLRPDEQERRDLEATLQRMREQADKVARELAARQRELSDLVDRTNAEKTRTSDELSDLAARKVRLEEQIRQTAAARERILKADSVVSPTPSPPVTVESPSRPASARDRSRQKYIPVIPP